MMWGEGEETGHRAVGQDQGEDGSFELSYSNHIFVIV